MFRYVTLLFLLLALSSPVAAQEKAECRQSFADLVEELLPGVVNISTVRQEAAGSAMPEVLSANEYLRDYFLRDEGGRTSLGSGFLIDGKGYIVTNNHVIDKADEIIVRLADDRQYNAVVVGRDRMTDLALLKIDAAEALPYVRLGDSDKLRAGDWILAVGNPFGLGGSVSAGIVSAKSRDIDAGSYDSFIQTDAAINQGSSGGPLFNMQGEVVGINTALFSSNGASMGIGFATPVNLSKFVIEQLMSKGRVERGWIGVKVISNTEPLTVSEQSEFHGGVTVSSLSENSPAALVGIEAGDIIMTLNGADIKNAKDFSRRIAETPAGTSVILRIWHERRIKDVTLTIATMPEPSVAQAKPAKEDAAPAGYIASLGLVAENKDQTVVAAEVLADSEAAAKGIKAGDIISKADGKTVSSVEDLSSYAAYAGAAGRPLELTVISDGMPQTLILNGETNGAN